MPRVHTHYDNLKVARDAPIEVIRAAYKSLSMKYHPDRNPGDPDAARIMAIINGAYEVLSDPAKRHQHDAWIREAESQSAPPRTSYERGSESTTSTSTREREFDLVAHVRSYWVAYGILALIAWGFLDDSSSSKRRSAPPGPSVYTPTAPAVPTSTATAPPLDLIPVYTRPYFAPNGEPWPLTSGYVKGYKRLHTNGLSSVIVDNSQNDSDAFVKLVSLDRTQPTAVRVFLILARSRFEVKSVRAGNYDIRYQDLGSGGISKSEPFNLAEIVETDGTRYSKFTLTLYKVRGGNTRMTRISEAEF